MASSSVIPLNAYRDPLPEDIDDDIGANRGIPIRAISRAISVLQAINQAGSLNMMEIAHTSRVPYPTACRIVQTLLHEGLIEREERRKYYRPTVLVQTLAQGFQGHGQLISAARPRMAALTHRIGWPISLSTHVGSSMILRGSTHAQTSLCFNEYHPGYAMPILDCAAGLVHLAFSSAHDRDTILTNLSRFGGEDVRRMLVLLHEGSLLEGIRSSGYAARGHNRFTLNPGKTSSIAVPIIVGESVIGCLTVAFFAATIELRGAVRELLPLLRECAETIAGDMAIPDLPESMEALP